MTGQQTIERNDLLRTRLQGGIVLFTPSVWELPAEIRGRLIDRISRIEKFTDDSLHDNGSVIFAGCAFRWSIDVSRA